MHPDLLFLQRCEQLAWLSQAETNELITLDTAAIIRQLLFDRASLANTVNSNKLQLRFVVGKPDFDLRNPPMMAFMIGGIDPVGFGSREEEHLTLSHEEFGKHVVAAVNYQLVNIKTLIKFCANQQGGVHYATSVKDEFKALEGFRQLPFGATSMLSGMVPQIGKVVQRGLSPLIDDVRRRLPT